MLPNPHAVDTMIYNWRISNDWRILLQPVHRLTWTLLHDMRLIKARTLASSPWRPWAVVWTLRSCSASCLRRASWAWASASSSALSSSPWASSLSWAWASARKLSFRVAWSSVRSCPLFSPTFRRASAD